MSNRLTLGEEVSLTHDFVAGWRYFWAATERPALFIIGFMLAMMLLNFVAMVAWRLLQEFK